MAHQVRPVTAALVSVVLAVGLWFALVPHSDADRTDPRVPAFWWIMILVAASWASPSGAVAPCSSPSL